MNMASASLKYGPSFFRSGCVSVASRSLFKRRLRLLPISQRGVTRLLSERSRYLAKYTLVSLAHQQRRHFRLSASTGSESVIVVETPAFAESISDGDIKLDKTVGDVVAEDEQVAEIETDKTTIPVNAPAAGEITEFLVEDGEKVTPGTKLFKLKVGGAGAAKPAGELPKSTREATSIPEAPPVPTPSVASPVVQDRPVPTELPPFPAQIPPLPSGPMATVTPTPPPSVSTPSRGVQSSRSENRVKMTRMRQRIAERLKGAQNELAMLTTFNEIDMSNVIEMRKKHGEAFLKKHGLKLGFMSPFVKASVFALQDQPIVNAVIEGNEIVYRDYIDISVAVASPKGLVVPVLRNCESLTFADVERAIQEFGLKARDNTLAIEDMDGGTFTISNGGVFGSMFGTPIINPPQSAILGMHATMERPVAVNGKIEIRPMMYVALTYDHRLIDGREAVTFLKKIKSAVEDPRTLLLDV